MSKCVAVAFSANGSALDIVRVELGFVPDAWLFISDHAGTNPNIFIGFNNRYMSDWTNALGLLVTGSTGVVTRDTASIDEWVGSNEILTAEATAGNTHDYVDMTGAEITKAAGDASKPGVQIPADHFPGTADKCVLIAVQFDNRV
jgi:hypothetical protein